ncbi:hypothetical protein ACG7TL_003527 [Trametes sanguinea]
MAEDNQGMDEAPNGEGQRDVSPRPDAGQPGEPRVSPQREGDLPGPDEPREGEADDSRPQSPSNASNHDAARSEHHEPPPPDFSRRAFARLRARLIESGVASDEDDAADYLLADWLEGREEERQGRRQRRGQSAPRGRQSSVDHRPETQQQAPATARPNTFVPRQPSPTPSSTKPIAPYAANKLRLQQYVDLWYFTEEGLSRAGGYQAYEGESSVTLAQASSAIVVTAPTPPSKDAKRDEELTWDQVSKARTSFLSYAKGYGWKAEHLEMFSIFFICLDAHPIRNEPKGNETVIQYQAHYRRQWHLTCEQQHAAAFDLATISDDALRTIRAKIIEQHTWATLQSPKRRSVSPHGRDAPHKRARAGGPHLSFPSRREHASRNDWREPAYGSANNSASFLEGAETTEHVVCAICLGLHTPAEVVKCTATKLWNGRPARCNRIGNRIQSDTGVAICINWQRVSGCSSRSHDERHEQQRPLTPLRADEWESQLRVAGLLDTYPHLVPSIRHGFISDIPSIYRTFTPLNSPSLFSPAGEFQRIIDHEFATGRYIGPFSRLSLESLIGPFQSSPLSLIPKPHKPHVFRLIQNFSFPRQPSNGISSINYHIDPANFPCTWGTFHAFALLCWRLPPGSQGAVRDVAEAYRIIPLHHSQWPGTVVRLGDDQFAVDTCAAFGVGSHAGLYGSLADACTDIMRARGLGPMAKWVDDTVFLRIRREHLVSYNQQRSVWREQIVRHGGVRHSGGRLWFGGDELPDGNVDEFVEDMRFPLCDLADASPRSESDALYSYCLSDIDAISSSLGVPWQPEKDHPFSSEFPFTGFLWNLDGARSVSISRAKADKYIAAIDVWLQKPTHDLKEVQQLHGKLWHASLVVQRGRAFLVNLEAMLGIFHDRPFVPRTPPRHTAADLKWWRATLSRSSLSRQLPSPCAVWDPLAYSDASSGVGIAVVIRDRWRAWRLLPGWKSDGRDIGWAEAVGFELLVHTVLVVSRARDGCAFKVYGDNRGVVEGWWRGRSRNHPTNEVFKRITAELEEQQSRVLTRYVQSAVNPADGPSRGIYPSSTLLLPPIPIPAELRPFIIDFDAPPTTHTPAANSSADAGKTRHSTKSISTGAQRTGTTSKTRFDAALPPRRTAKRPPRATFRDGLQLNPSILRPACAAKERLLKWTPSSSRRQRDANGDASQLSPDDIQRITDVSAYAWAESTLGTYGTGLLIFHVFCDLRSIPEEHRAPASELLILAFVASIAGSYAQSAINNYVAGVRAWHILHGLPWHVDKSRYDAALAGAAQLAPPASKKPSRAPLALQEIASMAPSFTLADPLDAAVWACLCVGFFSLARLGELTVTTQKSFQTDLHPSRASVRSEAHRDGSEVRVIRLPRTKSAIAGEDISFARQVGAIDPWAALDNHFAVNQLAPSVHLFAYRKPSNNAIVPLTRRAFLARVKVAALGIGLPNVSGHSLRIGGTLEYLLRGLSFETVKAIGRWKSEAFTLYLRKHAQVLAPYLQDNQEVLGELSRRTIQLPPVR